MGGNSYCKAVFVREGQVLKKFTQIYDRMKPFRESDTLLYR